MTPTIKTNKNSLSIIFCLLLGCTPQPTPINPLTLDVDEDGFTPEDGDCDDNNIYANPSAGYNEKEEGCYLDVDGDGYGSQKATAPYSPGTDCHDNQIRIHPGVEKAYPKRCLKDEDQDGYGDSKAGKNHLAGRDCNDENPKIHATSTDEWGILHCPLHPTSKIGSVAYLQEEEKKIFWQSREDPPPKRLDGVGAQQVGLHYLTSNEGHPYLFYPKLKDLGGGYVGVGSEQNYLFIDWQKPRFAWISDYDPWIKQIHQIYHLFFLHAKTPDEFLALWQPAQMQQAQKLIQQAYPLPQQKALLIGRYKRARNKIMLRLQLIKKKMQEKKIPSFLTNQNSYLYIRAMIKAKRIRPLQGNLLDQTGIIALGKAAKQLQTPIRVLYLSNAEQYWNYNGVFRTNMRALPVDNKSILIRTILTWKRNFDYAYIVQPFHRYLDWLDRPGTKKVYNITPKPSGPGTDPIFLFFDK